MERSIERATGARMARPALSVSNWTVAGLLAAVLPLSFVAAGTSVLAGDVATTNAVQTHLPGMFEPLITAANLLGEAPFLLAIVFGIAASLFVRGHRRLALIVGMASLAQGVNWLLKLSLESPRPAGDLVRVSEHANGFGFPSGHVMGTTVLALVLFYVASLLMATGPRRRIVQTGLLLTPLVMGVARVEAGAHWPSDVLGAWLWGTLAAIAIVITVERPWNGLPLSATRSARSVQPAIAMSEVRRSMQR
jgi:undecaprenyl-diphosphatase